MKLSTTARSMPGRSVYSLVIFTLWTLAASVSAAMPLAGTNEDFSAVSQSVVELLQSRDTARFAREISASREDWQSIVSTNVARQNPDAVAGLQKTSDYDRQNIEQSAKQLLAKADSLHLDFSKSDLRTKVIPPRFLGMTRYPSFMDENERIPSAPKLEIILSAGSDAKSPPNGDFKLVLSRMLKFPDGWRCLQGIQWASFPTNIADPKTLRELALLQKAAAYQGITGQDDPALLKLGDALVHFIRERDAGIFANEAYITADLVWSMYQQSGRQGPTRKELDDELNAQAQEQMNHARSTVQVMEDAGIDLKNADIQIKEASVERLQSPGAPGSVVGLMGEQFALTLAVKTDGKSKNGTPLSGDYVLAATEITRFADDWKVMDNVHWQKLPGGILDADTTAKMNLENYVAEYGTLPPLTTVPEIEFTALDGEKKMNLSDLRGKVVVLDFWATWCGPCQEPMARLQTLRQTHPDWQDRVAIVPLSIDDTMKIVCDHVDKRGWTNTFNVWAGDGGWHSKPAIAFRVRGVPTTYIIDGHGQVIRAGHPASMDIGKEVDTLLAQAKSRAQVNP